MINKKCKSKCKSANLPYREYEDEEDLIMDSAKMAEVLESWADVYNPKDAKVKKRKVASGYSRLIIDVLANGYSIDVGNGEGACEETYIFPDLESMNKWIKDNISPTYKNANFMEAL